MKNRVRCKDLKMNDATYKLRRQVIDLIYEAKALVDFPRVCKMKIIDVNFKDMDCEPDLVFITRRLYDLKRYYGEDRLLAAIATKKVKSPANSMLLVHLENLVLTYGRQACRNGLEIVCPIVKQGSA